MWRGVQKVINGRCRSTDAVDRRQQAADERLLWFKVQSYAFLCVRKLQIAYDL